MKTLIALLLIACASTQAGNVIKVEKLGGGDATTIQAGINMAPDGAVVEIGPGKYDEAIIIDRSVTLRGAGPQYVSITGAVGQPTVQVGDPVTEVPVAVTLDGITVGSGSNNGINLNNGTSTTVRNCVIADCAAEGIHHYTYDDSRYDSSGLSLFVRNCTFANCRFRAVNVDVRNNSDITIEDSIFYKNNEGTTENFQATYGSALSGIYYTLGRVVSIGKTPISTGHARGGTGWIAATVADPRFINAGTGNYILQYPSGAQDKGTPGINQLDPDGTTSDVGAYSGPNAARFWPYPVGGPRMTDMTVSPGAVIQGGKVTVKATATTR